MGNRTDTDRRSTATGGTQMSDVAKRFDPRPLSNREQYEMEEISLMTEHRIGSYVLYDDHAKLEAKNERLRELLKCVVEWKDRYSDGVAVGAETLAKITQDARKELEKRK
jgi:predicted SprT family Zn-dependent metalloprotease